MKCTCPTCRGAGISMLAKRWSARECPATCALCGGLSHVLASTSNGIFVGGILAFVAGLVAGIAATGQGVAGAVAAVCVAVTFNVWAWRRAELFPIPRENARAAAAGGWFAIALCALWSMFSG